MRLAPAVLSLFGWVLGLVVLVGACRGERDAPRGIAPTPTGEGGSGGGFEPGIGAGCAVEGLCGDEVHELRFERPNVYFILDRSGSMAEPVAGTTRYALVRAGAIAMVSQLGGLINVGAALFPHGNIDANACTDGGEVMPVTKGGSAAVVENFAFRTNVTPKGGTPIAATLERLRPKLAALEGRTVAFLLTDGGPNCNGSLSCGIADCIPNIEGLCDPTDNCCASGHPGGGPFNCLDREATLAEVAALAALGVEIYVIGIAGSEAYAGLLDELAEAAGTAKSLGPTKHQRVADLEAIAALFQELAAAQISCSITLADPPTERDFTNVYFDCDLVAQDASSGWTFEDETQSTVVLHGAACAELKSGGVSEVHVVSGCPTEPPR